MNLKKREDTGDWKRKHWSALCRELAWRRLWTCRKTDYWTNEL